MESITKLPKDCRIIRLPEVKKATGLARSTIYLKMAKKKFPTQISLGPRSVGWLENEIQNWIHDQISRSRVTE